MIRKKERGFSSPIAIIAIIIALLLGIGSYFVVKIQSDKNIEPTPLPIPEGKVLSQTELKYQLEQAFGEAVFCGPPVVRDDYDLELLKQFPNIEMNTAEFSDILKHTDILNSGVWTDIQKLAIVNEYNRLSTITLVPQGAGNYTFSIRSRYGDENNEFITEGNILENGKIKITKKTPYMFGCPICLAKDTKIDTPQGQKLIQDLHKGDPIWTVDVFGKRVRDFVGETVSVSVPPNHKVVHLVLSDGRELFVSPGHPTVDGRTVGSILPKEIYDGSNVLATERVFYSEKTTYDVLPGGQTGFYFANGILLGSTLHK